MRQSSNIVIALMVLLSLASCGNRNQNGDKLPKVEDEALLFTLDSLAQQDFKYFYSKLSTEYKDSARNVSFKTSVRMVKDSAIQILVSYASIPVINAVVKPDSVMMTNSQENCYMRQSIAYIRETFGVNFSQRNLEELFMGIPIGYDKNATYERVKDPYAYILSTKIIQDGDKEVTMFYEFSADLKELKSMRIESKEDGTNMKIDYLTRELIDGKNLPYQVHVSILTPKQEISMDLEYKKTRTNEVEQIHFVIPESYEECK